jgi:hypothetical protein
MPKENYEVSSESAVRHWEVPFARLENATPAITEPAALLSRIDGTQLTGTVLVVDDDDDIAIVDFTHSMVYLHDVRNVRTYYQGAAATWGVINIGDPIFYDRSATMPANVYLSTSPLDEDGNDNPLFGFRVIPHDETDVAAKGSSAAATVEIAVMQVVGD